MNRSAVKSLAVGALLFGGTLGVTPDAHAGLVWTGSDAGTGILLPGVAYNYNPPLNSPTTVSDPVTGASLTVSAAMENTGWSLSGVLPQGTSARFGMVRFFTVTGSVSVSVTGFRESGLWANWSIYATQGANGQSTALIWRNLSSSAPPVGSFDSGTISLSAGTYSIGGIFYTGPSGVGVSTSGTFMNFAVVPTPGAIALLAGVAGVAGRRRRA